MTNSLAYYDTEYNTIMKRFIVPAPGVYVCVCVCVCVSVCVRARERESVCVYQWKWKREICVYICVREC